MKREGFFCGGSLLRKSFLIPGKQFYDYERNSDTDIPEENHWGKFQPESVCSHSKHYMKQTTKFINYVSGFVPMVVIS